MDKLDPGAKVRTISLFVLVMLITGAIDSLRNLPTTALFGETLVFFFIFSAIVFLIPAGLIAAELSSLSAREGGIYHWIKLAFGENFAFLAVWLQWINTMVWYPTILSFIAGTATYLINPALAQNKIYLVSVILSVFWSLTLINLRGVNISARFASFCGTIGMSLPMGLIIILGIIWVANGKPMQLHLSLENMVPSFARTDNWISLTAIMTAFLGMELAAVHVNHVKNPQQVFPRAMLISVLFILITMIFGSLAIALVLPAEQINLVNGVMQAFSNYFGIYHMSWMMPLIALMILLGSLGGMINWIISPAKGLLQAAQDGFLPAVLRKENKAGAATNLLVLQAVIVSLVCMVFLLMPSVNGSYWLLTALSTQLYMLMYVLMFCAAVRIRYKHAHLPRAFTIPGGKIGMLIVAGLGLVGCTITLIVGFFPPSSINVGSAGHFEMMFTGGLIIMTLPVFGFYFYRKYINKSVRSVTHLPNLDSLA